MNDQQIRDQSESAIKQWGEQWERHCQIHSKDPQVTNSLMDFGASGIGKAILLCANGYSLEENIKTIRQNQNGVDIIACDKTLGHLIDNGIKPKFCLVCDANVDYDRYLKPFENQLDETILLINVCANPQWSQNGNWKRKYFFVNKDILDSQIKFSKISGCTNFIPAGTNVSNAMLIMLTQCDNQGKRNFFGYDKFLLIGYDYSWRHGGKYYAFSQDGDGKADYMKHHYCLTLDHDWAYTSGNLLFSAQWLEKYMSVFKLPVINCSKKTILHQTKFGELREQMQYNFKHEDSNRVRAICLDLDRVIKLKQRLDAELKQIEIEHHRAVMVSI